MLFGRCTSGELQVVITHLLLRLMAGVRRPDRRHKETDWHLREKGSVVGTEEQ